MRAKHQNHLTSVQLPLVMSSDLMVELETGSPPASRSPLEATAGNVDTAWGTIVAAIGTPTGTTGTIGTATPAGSTPGAVLMVRAKLICCRISFSFSRAAFSFSKSSPTSGTGSAAAGATVLAKTSFEVLMSRFSTASSEIDISILDSRPTGLADYLISLRNKCNCNSGLGLGNV